MQSGPTVLSEAEVMGRPRRLSAAPRHRGARNVSDRVRDPTPGRGLAQWLIAVRMPSSRTTSAFAPALRLQLDGCLVGRRVAGRVGSGDGHLRLQLLVLAQGLDDRLV